MSNGVFYIKAFPTEASEGYLWDVSCVDCEESIGTMHSSTLQEAVLKNAHRGGIKCPKCRAASCQACGENTLTTRGEMPKPFYFGLGSDVLLVCPLCEMELSQRGGPNLHRAAKLAFRPK